MKFDPSPLIQSLTERLGPKGVITDQHDIAPWLVDWRGRFHGQSAAIIAPTSTAEVSMIVAMAGAAGVALVPQGGNTSMVGGATPPADGSALILSLRRMNLIRQVDPVGNLAIAEAGVILPKPRPQMKPPFPLLAILSHGHCASRLSIAPPSAGMTAR